MTPDPGAPPRPGERSATGFPTEHAQRQGGMRDAGPNLDVALAIEESAAHTTVPGPEALELQAHWLQVHDPNRSGLGNGSVSVRPCSQRGLPRAGREKIAAP